MLRVVMAIVFALMASPIYAGEINFLGGFGVTSNPTQNTYAWLARLSGFNITNH